GAARSVGNTPERSCRPGYRGGVRPTAPRALRDSGIRLLATDFTVRVQPMTKDTQRSEEHTSELQSLTNLVCRLLLEKKKEITYPIASYCHKPLYQDSTPQHEIIQTGTDDRMVTAQIHTDSNTQYRPSSTRSRHTTSH